MVLARVTRGYHRHSQPREVAVAILVSRTEAVPSELFVRVAPPSPRLADMDDIRDQSSCALCSLPTRRASRG